MIIELKVTDMACPKGYRFAYGACAKSITEAIQNVDSQANVQADTKTKQVTIETEVSESSVREVIISAGYNPA